jgi:hypothetical protein
MELLVIYLPVSHRYKTTAKLLYFRLNVFVSSIFFLSSGSGKFLSCVNTLSYVVSPDILRERK